MRILVTGSRTLLWSDRAFILSAILDAVASGVGPHVIAALGGRVLGDRLTIVHGDCPRGADALADSLAREHGWQVERHPSAWSRYGMRAGFVRNAEMVKLGADVCLAFIEDDSRGASMCADLAERAGIPVVRFTRQEGSPWLRNKTIPRSS